MEQDKRGSVARASRAVQYIYFRVTFPGYLSYFARWRDSENCHHDEHGRRHDAMTALLLFSATRWWLLMTDRT